MRVRRHPPIGIGTAVLVLAALFASALGFAGTARGEVFGSDLSKPANATFGCELSPFQLNYGIAPPLGTFDGSSCTWHLSNDGRAWPQRSGTLNKVRIKSGPQVGPTRIVVLRSLWGYDATGSNFAQVCCNVPFATESFTPAPNAVTELNVAIPMVGGDAVRHGPNEEGVIDSIGISQVTAGQTLPMFDGGIAARQTSPPLTFGWHPQLTVADGLRSSNGGAGALELLVQGDLSPCPNGPATARRPLAACAPDPGGDSPPPGTPTDPGDVPVTPDGPDLGPDSDAAQQCAAAEQQLDSMKRKLKRAKKKAKKAKRKARKAKRRAKRGEGGGKQAKKAKRKAKQAKKSVKRARKRKKRAAQAQLEACAQVQMTVLAADELARGGGRR